MNDRLFCVENLRVAYPELQGQSSWAVDDVSFSLAPGERLGLVGESGCGKSTLGRAAMRLLPKSSRIEGRVTFAGESVFEMNAHRLRQFRGEVVALVFQDPMTRLDPLMTIGDHCVETLQAHQSHLSRSQAKQKSIAILQAVNIPENRWSQYPHEFSGGMRQRVAIALALILDPKLIVADEPTTSLDVTVAAQILDELTRLCEERGTSLLLISHDLAMVGEYCDRIAVMYQGQMVETGPVKKVLANPQHQYTKSLLEAALHVQSVGEEGSPPAPLDRGGERTDNPSVSRRTGVSPVPPANPSTPSVSRRTGVSPVPPANPSLKSRRTGVSPVPPPNPSPILRLKELQQHYSLESNFIQQLFSKTKQTIKAVDGVSLDLSAGEILGLVGESGCGKSTLSRTILQLVRPTGGIVEFQGTDLTVLSARQMQPYRRQMQMVFQDPHACLNPMMNVADCIAAPLFVHKLANRQEARTRVEQMLERVGLTPTAEYGKRYPSELSGGQQQRVAIARALITNPKLVICDEPVSMLDASVQRQVLELMLELKEEFGLTYLFITHDLWVARFFCDRIAVMNSGKIVELGETQQIFSNPQHPYTKTLLQAAPLLSS
ncbi:MAG: ABC transporter ATP-binding protein [Cyanobacteriota bacterium]|nr:ABC transporter ATP-binding protein [Cyanobacteriota bacterium]